MGKNIKLKPRVVKSKKKFFSKKYQKLIHYIIKSFKKRINL